jgi:cytochrome c2
MSEESGRIRNSSITTRSRRADTLQPGNSRDSFQKRFARASDRFANQAEDFDIGEALQEKCFPCHQSAKDRDYVFTHYALTP